MHVRNSRDNEGFSWRSGIRFARKCSPLAPLDYYIADAATTKKTRRKDTHYSIVHSQPVGDSGPAALLACARSQSSPNLVQCVRRMSSPCLQSHIHKRISALAFQIAISSKSYPPLSTGTFDFCPAVLYMFS